MGFSELKAELDALSSVYKQARASKQGKPDDLFVIHAAEFLTKLLFEINSNLDSIAVDYKMMRKLMETRSGVAANAKKDH